MSMAVKVKTLLAARRMTIADLADRIEPRTTRQNVNTKLKRDHLSEHDLHQIAKACDATFEGIFTLNDTGNTSPHTVWLNQP